MLPMLFGRLTVIMHTGRIIRAEFHLTTHNPTGPDYQNQNHPQDLDG